MKKLLILLAVASFGFASCGEKESDGSSSEGVEQLDDKAQLMADIEVIEKELFSMKDEKIMQGKANKILALYKKFANEYREDPEAPECLFKAAEVSMGLENYEHSVQLFNRARNEFPDFNKAAECLYIQGFVYDYHMDQKGKAKEIYQEVIDTYPDHQFAGDAQLAIDALGMSDEDLIRMFEEKQAEAEAQEAS